MTYLELINNVLVRLRETKVTSATYESTPYYLSIGAHVNDAKDRVEDAWQWSSLRNVDSVPLAPFSGPDYFLPDSADNHYIIKGFYASDTAVSGDAYYPITHITKESMIARYAGGYDNAPINGPAEVAVMRKDPDTGLIVVSVWPKQDVATDAVLLVDRVRHQPTLEVQDTRLFVPSLPVYTLATALASRERGEVGGAPTSELFAIADRHLSDAVAQDTADFVEEMDWFAQDHLSETNWRR